MRRHMYDPIELLDKRLSAGITQVALADEIGISPQFLSEVLHRKRKPSTRVLDFLGLEKCITYRLKPASTETVDAEKKPRRRRA